MARPTRYQARGVGTLIRRQEPIERRAENSNAVDHPKCASARKVRLERTAAELCRGRIVSLVALVQASLWHLGRNTLTQVADWRRARRVLITEAVTPRVRSYAIVPELEVVRAGAVDFE
jgi:hypothetical protein